jgi:hypothetical protein
MEWTTAITIALLGAVLTGHIATTKDRHFLRWFVFGFLFLIVALPAVLLVDRDNRQRCPGCWTWQSRQRNECRKCRAPLGQSARA